MRVKNLYSVQFTTKGKIWKYKLYILYILIHIQVKRNELFIQCFYWHLTSLQWISQNTRSTGTLEGRTL